jgi:hypothetical protein
LRFLIRGHVDQEPAGDDGTHPFDPQPLIACKHRLGRIAYVGLNEQVAVVQHIKAVVGEPVQGEVGKAVKLRALMPDRVVGLG